MTYICDIVDLIDTNFDDPDVGQYFSKIMTILEDNKMKYEHDSLNDIYKLLEQDKIVLNSLRNVFNEYIESKLNNIIMNKIIDIMHKCYVNNNNPTMIDIAVEKINIIKNKFLDFSSKYKWQSILTNIIVLGIESYDSNNCNIIIKYLTDLNKINNERTMCYCFSTNIWKYEDEKIKIKICNDCCDVVIT